MALFDVLSIRCVLYFPRRQARNILLIKAGCDRTFQCKTKTANFDANILPEKFNSL